MEIDVQALKERIEGGEKLLIIDVREPNEHAEFSIPSENIPLGTLPGRIYDFDDDLEQEIVLYCRSGQRSAMAQGLFLQTGFKNVLNLKGGMLEWQSRFGG